MIQICCTVDDIVDRVYSRDDLRLLFSRRSADGSSMPQFDDNGLSTPADSDHFATGGQNQSQLATCAGSISLPTAEVSLSTSRSLTCDIVESESTNYSSVSGTSALQSPSPMTLLSDVVSEFRVHLAPLSDFLTQHLALLQTWLRCASYRQLVDLLCRHIAEVIFIDFCCRAEGTLLHIAVVCSIHFCK